MGVFLHFRSGRGLGGLELAGELLLSGSCEELIDSVPRCRHRLLIGCAQMSSGSSQASL